MRKSLLNNYELAVLHRGAEEERNNGIQIHSYPEMETNGLLTDYYAWAMEGAKVDYECVIGALKDLFEWWATYFTCGEETARAIHNEYNEELLKELNEKCEANRRKNEEELEAMLNVKQ